MSDSAAANPEGGSIPSIDDELPPRTSSNIEHQSILQVLQCSSPHPSTSQSSNNTSLLNTMPQPSSSHLQSSSSSFLSSRTPTSRIQSNPSSQKYQQHKFIRNTAELNELKKKKLLSPSYPYKKTVFVSSDSYRSQPKGASTMLNVPATVTVPIVRANIYPPRVADDAQSTPKPRFIIPTQTSRNIAPLQNPKYSTISSTLKAKTPSNQSSSTPQYARLIGPRTIPINTPPQSHNILKPMEYSRPLGVSSDHSYVKSHPICLEGQVEIPAHHVVVRPKVVVKQTPVNDLLNSVSGSVSTDMSPSVQNSKNTIAVPSKPKQRRKTAIVTDDDVSNSRTSFDKEPKLLVDMSLAQSDERLKGQTNEQESIESSAVEIVDTQIESIDGGNNIVHTPAAKVKSGAKTASKTPRDKNQVKQLTEPYNPVPVNDETRAELRYRKLRWREFYSWYPKNDVRIDCHKYGLPRFDHWKTYENGHEWLTYKTKLRMNSLRFNPNLRLPYIATCGPDRNVTIWNYITDSIIWHFAGHSKPIIDLSWSINGALVTTVSEDKKIKVFQMDTSLAYEVCSFYTNHPIGGGGEFELISSRFSQDMRSIFAADSNGTLYMCDTRSGQIEFQGNGLPPISCIESHPETHSLLAIGTEIGQIHIIDMMAFQKAKGASVIRVLDQQWDMEETTPKMMRGGVERIEKGWRRLSDMPKLVQYGHKGYNPLFIDDGPIKSIRYECNPDDDTPGMKLVVTRGVDTRNNGKSCIYRIDAEKLKTHQTKYCSSVSKYNANITCSTMVYTRDECKDNRSDLFAQQDDRSVVNDLSYELIPECVSSIGDPYRSEFKSEKHSMITAIDNHPEPDARMFAVGGWGRRPQMKIYRIPRFESIHDDDDIDCVRKAKERRSFIDQDRDDSYD